jgi:uncharacterized protein
MAVIDFSISETAPTSQEALKNANDKMNQIVSIVTSKGVDSNDIQTTQFNVYPDYDYSTNTPVIKDQRATLGVEVKIKKLDATAAKATDVVDSVSKINNIQIGQINFDIEDKTAFYTQARSLAFSKAKQKAQELANNAGVKLLTPVSISDVSVTPTPIVYQPMAVNSAIGKASGTSDSSSSNVSTGELELTANINVIFGID